MLPLRMTNPFFRTALSVAALTLVGIVLYYGIVFDGQLPDYRWLHGKNDLALHALAFFALSLPVLILWPRRHPGVDDILAGLAGIALGVLVVWGLHRLFGLRSDRQHRPSPKGQIK